jgi:hypothetical protein
VKVLPVAFAGACGVLLRYGISSGFPLRAAVYIFASVALAFAAAAGGYYLGRALE